MNSNLTKFDYSNKNIYIGIDVHVKHWTVTVICEESIKTQTVVSKADKLAEYLKRVYPNGNYYAAYEAGCFGFHIKEKLDKLGVFTIVINPADIPTTDKDSRNKTDNSDSKKIALSLKSAMVKGIYVPSRDALEHRMLSRRRGDISVKTTRVKNQIKGKLKLIGEDFPEMFSKSSNHWSNNFIKWLESLDFANDSGDSTMESLLRELRFYRSEQLIILNKLRALSKSEKFKRNSEILRSIPGIGAIGTTTFLTEVIDITRFETRDKYLSYVGLSPNEHSSGERRKIGRLTKRCNKNLRTLFIEASWVAVRKDPILEQYFKENSKIMCKQKAIVKVARKLASRTRYLLLKQMTYDLGIVV